MLDIFLLKSIRFLHLIDKDRYRQKRYLILINSSNYFDKEWYKEKYNLKNIDNLALHYLEIGWKLGFNPSEYFSTKKYLDKNTDVAAIGINPLIHYEIHGKNENRCPWLQKSNIFKPYGFFYHFLRKLSKIYYKEKIIKNRNARILVHLHLYYTSAWAEIKEYLDNLSCYRYDLIITYREDIEDNTFLENIKAYKVDCKLMPYPNKGFDIGPFVDLLGKVNLRKYDIIYHLHSKSVASGKGRITYKRLFKGKSWFLQLFSGTLGVFNIHKGIDLLMNNKKVGMIGACNLLFSDTLERQSMVKQYANRYNILVPENYVFIGGSCFGIKAEILKSIKNLGLTIDSFKESRRYIFTLAHALERLIPIQVLNNGYEIKGQITLYNNHSRYVSYILKKKNKELKKTEKYLRKKGFSNIKPLVMDLKSGLNCKFFTAFYKNKSVFIKVGGDSSIVRNEFEMQKKFQAILGGYVPTPIIFDEKLPFIAMEKLDGYNLDELMNFGLSRIDKKEVIRQLKDIKQKLKKTNLLHRDIRPANIFYTCDKKVKLLDFQYGVFVDDNGRYNELEYIKKHHEMFQNLGEEYRINKDDFNDIYSVNEIIKMLQRK